MKNRIVLISGLLVVLLLACAGPAEGEVVPTPIASKPGLEQTVTVNGITVRLIKATFSSNETHLWLELEHPTCTIEDITPPISLFVPMQLERDIALQGFEDAEVRGERNMADGNIEPIQLSLGPVADSQQLVVVEILRLWARQPNGPAQLVEGPWRFEFTPGKAAIDPLDKEIVVNQSVEHDGIKIDVERIHLSSSKVKVYCEMTLNLSECVGQTGSATFIYPDGTFVGGEGGGWGEFGCGPAGRQKSLVFDFPPLPEGVPTLTLKFGEFSKAEPSPYTAVIPLPDEVRAVDAASLKELLRFPLGDTISLAGAELRVDYVELGPYRGSREEVNVVALKIENANLGEPSVVFLGPGSHPSLSDDVGNTYAATWSGEKHRQSESREIEAVETYLRFVGPLQPGVTELRLTADSIARILKGPWKFEVAIPK